jgi:hypothetical protein
MADSLVYAVFGLLDEVASRRVRALQQQLTGRTGDRTASFFPVHVTIRGRFRAQPRLAGAAFRRFCESERHAPGAIELTGPVFRAPDLAWLEVGRSSRSFRELRRIHGNADDAVRGILDQDEVAAEHTGDGYTPHVTLGWGCNEEDVRALAAQEPSLVIAARLVAVALAKYPAGWPVSEELEVVDLQRLQESGMG